MEIKYKEDKKSLQISTRMFLDDTEVALRDFIGNDTLDVMKEANWDFVEKSLGEYFLQNFSIKDDKKQLPLVYLGAEIEYDVIWTYIEIEKVKKLKTVKVKNTLLTEIFSDQENLVHFRALETVKSGRFGRRKEKMVFNWD